MGLDPMLWGPKGWFFLHSITFNYPKNPSVSDKTNYKMFFEQLSNVLPCEFCSEHFKKNLEKYPLNEEVLQNNKNLIQWLINIHNEVDVLNNKRKSFLGRLRGYFTLRIDSGTLKMPYICWLISKS